MHLNDLIHWLRIISNSLDFVNHLLSIFVLFYYTCSFYIRFGKLVVNLKNPGPNMLFYHKNGFKLFVKTSIKHIYSNALKIDVCGARYSAWYSRNVHLIYIYINSFIKSVCCKVVKMAFLVNEHLIMHYQHIPVSEFFFM